MPRSPSSLLLLFLLGGCTGDSKSTLSMLPELDLSHSRLNFGEVEWGDTQPRRLFIENKGDVPMGIASIALREEEMEENFTLSWTEDDIDCGYDPDAEDEEATTDSGADAGTQEEDAEDAGTAPQGESTVLDAGCVLTVTITFSPVTIGEVYTSLEVWSETEEVEEGSPSYYRDPDNEWRTVILHGTGLKEAGNIVASPLNIDFGPVWPGETATDYITLRNAGDGDLTLGAPTLDENCSSAFSITDTHEEGEVLEAETQTVVEVTFTPESVEEATCLLTLTSDDVDTPTVEVNLRGNTGDETGNHAPTAKVRDPLPGYVHGTYDDIVLEVNVFDEDQPAEMLDCSVYSAILLSETLADCTPSDESGHVYVSVPVTSYEEEEAYGTDTLVVEVTDASGVSAWASTTVLYRSDYPEDDDDGDGYGDSTDENLDCDDEDMHVYPDGAERHDGKDNDCDGIVDEGTEGYDDDEDGWTEEGGDCDDLDEDTYPEANEQADYADNDCDGTVDEGTSLYDDDDDGFTDAENDCDDDDPEINPAATELCDGEDNDCNGLQDQQDGCVSLASEPVIVGGVQMGVTTLGVGESTTMSVFVFDADSSELTYSWQQDPELTEAGWNAVDDPVAASITFSAPESLPKSAENGKIYDIYVVVLDEDGNQDWTAAEIEVLPQPVNQYSTSTQTSGGCQKEDGGEALLLLPVGVGAAVLRRRRRYRAV